MSKTNEAPEVAEAVEAVEPEEATAAPTPTVAAQREDDLTVWQAKAEEHLNDLKRVQADFENYKKRVKNEERELYGHLTSQIVAELVPVLTNLHAAASHVPKEAAESPWVMGITYIEKQFEDVLKNYGVEPIEVKPGDPFNPAEHEAVDHQPTEGKESAHQIEQVVQKGYKIKDRVIKAARVIVS